MAFKSSIQVRSIILLFIFFATFSLTTEACHPTDKAALLDFKSLINQDPTKLLKTWNASTDCCIQWEGVACGSNGRVVNLTRPGLFSTDDSIFDTFMNGTISPSLGNLEFLRFLDLSNLKQLSHLTDFFLDTNQLEGQIPASFQRLTKLRRMYLSDNRLSGPVPTSMLLQMSSLSELGLSNNQLSGEIPSSIQTLVSLTKIDIHGNQFSGSIPSTIGSLKQLNYVDLSANKFFRNYSSIHW
ncbi:hypothetical protein MKW92_016900 [Papaver armeniacum]|nr:hypothetical protein MKW92_016900 [Papaver armeniacum]